MVLNNYTQMFKFGSEQTHFIKMRRPILETRQLIATTTQKKCGWKPEFEGPSWLFKQVYIYIYHITV